MSIRVTFVMHSFWRQDSFYFIFLSFVLNSQPR
ncbi:rCG49107 [Rattus norvegicus]|uniref:RCG49107 n=1 Tax=Rattus norvegicus TaxID=10116 RepID=A6IG07_RAT|nr:rCG49107 [Rattus norvegicus]